jgi:hypothetical protein
MVLRAEGCNRGAAGGMGSLARMTLRDVELIGVPTNSSGTVDGWPRRQRCCVSVDCRQR